MSHHAKVWAIGTAGLLAAAMTGTLSAQAPQPGERAGAQGADANATGAIVVGDNANAASEGQDTQRLISNALCAVINGSDLHLAARAVRGGHQHDGQRQEAANRPSDKDANKDDAANKPKDNANEGQGQGQDEAARQRMQQENQQVAEQLQQQADRQIQAGSQLLRSAKDELGAEGGAAAPRAGERDAWSQRLYTAADQYATALRSVTGADQAQAGGSSNAADRGNENNAQGRDGQRLSRADAARVLLINQAVKGSLAAFELRQSNRANASNRASSQRLQERARQMATESDQLLHQVMAGANQDAGRQASGAQDNANDNAANKSETTAADSTARGNAEQNKGANNQGDENANNQGNQGQGRDNPRGRASVQALAQQAQQVVQTLERINSGDAPAAPGAAGVRESR